MFSFPNQQGFTLMELLVALLLTGLLAIMVAQYQTLSLQVRQLMQEERLAATAVEDLIIQMQLGGLLPGDPVFSLAAVDCSASHSHAGLDFTLVCQAFSELRSMSIRHQGQQLVLEWASPLGKRTLARPTH